MYSQYNSPLERQYQKTLIGSSIVNNGYVNSINTYGLNKGSTMDYNMSQQRDPIPSSYASPMIRRGGSSEYLANPVTSSNIQSSSFQANRNLMRAPAPDNDILNTDNSNRSSLHGGHNNNHDQMSRINERINKLREGMGESPIKSVTSKFIMPNSNSTLEYQTNHNSYTLPFTQIGGSNSQAAPDLFERRSTTKTVTNEILNPSNSKHRITSNSDPFDQTTSSTNQVIKPMQTSLQAQNAYNSAQSTYQAILDNSASTQVGRRESKRTRKNSTTSVDAVEQIKNRQSNKMNFDFMQRGTLNSLTNDPSIFVGLENPSKNFCYINSVLQCLMATPDLFKILSSRESKKHINSKSDYKGQIASAFHSLTKEYLNVSQENLNNKSDSPVSAASPQLKNDRHLQKRVDQFKQQISDYFEQFQGYEQQDAHEFLTCLLLGLNEDLNLAPKFNKPFEKVVPEKMAQDAYYKKMVQMMKERDQSTITDAFQGIIGDKILCMKCNKPRFKYDHQLIMSLPITDDKQPKSGTKGRGGNNFSIRSSDLMQQIKDRDDNSNYANNNSSTNVRTLSQCLDTFFEQELLPDTEKLTCTFCKKTAQVSKQTQLCTLPQVLIIHLKRFVFNEDYGDYKKLNDKVELSKTVNLTTQHGNQQATYNLYAIIHHYGSKNNGHYTSEVRDISGSGPLDHQQTAQSSDSAWYECDDYSIKQIRKPSLINNTAYLLFYYKQK